MLWRILIRQESNCLSFLSASGKTNNCVSEDLSSDSESNGLMDGSGDLAAAAVTTNAIDGGSIAAPTNLDGTPQASDRLIYSSGTLPRSLPQTLPIPPPPNEPPPATPRSSLRYGDHMNVLATTNDAFVGQLNNLMAGSGGTASRSHFAAGHADLVQPYSMVNHKDDSSFYLPPGECCCDCALTHFQHSTACSGGGSGWQTIPTLRLLFDFPCCRLLLI